MLLINFSSQKSNILNLNIDLGYLFLMGCLHPKIIWTKFIIKTPRPTNLYVQLITFVYKIFTKLISQSVTIYLKQFRKLRKKIKMFNFLLRNLISIKNYIFIFLQIFKKSK